MRQVFADTFYWIAIIDPSEEWHHQAVEVSRSLGSARLMIHLTLGLLCLLIGALFAGLVGPLHANPSTVRYQAWRRRR